MLTRLVLASSLFLLCGLAIVGWRNRSDPGAGVFGLLEAVSAVWVALTVVGLSLPPGVARLRVWGATTALSLLVVLLWMAFILRYTGRDRWLRPTRFGVHGARWSAALSSRPRRPGPPSASPSSRLAPRSASTSIWSSSPG
ncbi:hypothetical protein BRD14_06135 [Halobacteriales archaeon SW_5_68_122]|nr:MAG: hypothetical protein BRD14_06135 [Halobacteriales archaeon SW_5_68_122]